MRQNILKNSSKNLTINMPLELLGVPKQLFVVEELEEALVELSYVAPLQARGEVAPAEYGELSV